MPRLLLVLALLGLAGCGHSSHVPSTHGASATHRAGIITGCCARPQDARVSGVLVGIGGPSGTAVRHWAGAIRIRGRQYARVRTDDQGRFTARLAPGSYRVTGTSASYGGGKGECRASGRVRLRAHHTTHVRVVCQLK